MKKLFRLTKICTIISVLLFSFFMLTIAIITTNLNYKMPEILNVELYDDNGKKYLSYSNGKKQSYISLEDVSPYLVSAFVSIEDKRFFDHHGIDIIRIGGALVSNLKNQGLVEGASTITQQYVRNIYLSNEKTWKRKINEMLISLNIEKQYEKEDILEGYLNSIYFDHGIYGVEDASIFYFNKHAKDLTLAEAASIASIPKGPTIYSPIKNPEKNKERQLLILDELLKDDLITDEDYKNAINEQLSFIGNNPNDDITSAPYFQDIILEKLKDIPEIANYRASGLKVYTTLNTDLYVEINRSIKKRIPESDIEVAVYAIEAKTGKVLAVIGGKDYENSTYNRAISSVRQPGSTIKPFLYLSALENGFTVATTFMSEKTTFYYDNTSYSPTNFRDIYANFDVSMAYAIATSDNIYAVKTHLFLGCENLVDILKRFKFSGEIKPLPSLALGVKEVSVKEITCGYAAMANLGTFIEPIYITKITDIDDNVIYEEKVNKTKVADSSDVFLLNEAMTSIFDNNMTYNIRPTGVSIKSLLSTKYAGKSGSTDTDNWMIGFSPEIVVGVWTGYDDARIITNSSDMSFGKYIWADSVEAYYDLTNVLPTWYQVPSDVVGIEINPISGFYGSFDDYTKIMYFKKSNLPWFVQEKEKIN